MLGVYSCVCCLQVCEKIVQGAQKQDHLPGWGCSFPPCNLLHKLLPKQISKPCNLLITGGILGLWAQLTTCSSFSVCDPPTAPTITHLSFNCPESLLTHLQLTAIITSRWPLVSFCFPGSPYSPGDHHGHLSTAGRLMRTSSGVALPSLHLAVSVC